MKEGNQLIEIRRDLHRIPEEGFKEFKTQRYLLDYIDQIKNEFVEIKTWKTGIFVKVNGEIGDKTIGYRCDMDGLPIDEKTDFDFSSEHHGFMHACGHDFHMTIGLGLLKKVIENRIEPTVVFLFQPAEEGPGGALPMIQSQEFQLWKPDVIYGLHIAPEYPIGTIATRPGLLFAHTSELFIDLKGKGGHAAYPHATKDMVVAGAHLITQLQTIISRNVNPMSSGVVTIGKLRSGTVQNVIAEECRLEGTIRTLNKDTMVRVKERIEGIVKGIELGFDCRASIDYGAMYCGVNNDVEITQQFMHFVSKEEKWNLIECEAAMTGEDFGYMLEHVPGCMFWLGVDSEYGLHHNKLNPKEEVLNPTVQLLYKYFSS